MNAPPRIFISATSGDLRSVRQIVKEALLTINCHPVEQTNFEPDWRTVEGMLRGKIAGCQALIHIAGMRYGAEPDPITLPPGTPRRSYTQIEYHLGCQLHEERGDGGFRVYTFVCPEGFPYDIGAEPESEEKQALQRTHRAALLESPKLYESTASGESLQARILALQEQVLTIQQEQADVRKEVRRSHKTLVLVLAALLLLVSAVAVVHQLTQKGISEIKAGQVIDTVRIKTHLRESSERKLAEDLAAADKEKKSDDRERLRAAAQSAHQTRLSRIDELAASFAMLDGQADASPIFKEMTRTLQEEGVDAALAYAERQKPAILKAIAAADAAHLEQRRASLQPLLKAAGLQATKGQTKVARASYLELLKLDPQWPDALESFAWFLYDQSVQSKYHGTLAAALADATQCLETARRFHELDASQPRAQRVLSAAHQEMGDVLVLRGAKGDAAEVLEHFQQSLGLTEALYKAQPTYLDAARDVSVSLSKLGDYLASRGQAGDAEQALGHYQRSHQVLENLLGDNPQSAQAARDVSVSLERLGNFLANRRLAGDAEKALGYYTRALEISERLLAANPESAQAARDVSVSVEKLGDFLARRGLTGDAEKALRYYTRDLEISERLLAANPESAQAARGVSLSLNHLGAFLASRVLTEDAEKALGYYTRALEICERLLAANPESAQAARDVSLSLNNLGAFLAGRGLAGDADKALGYYTRDLEICERLLAANPESAQAAREVLVSLSSLGDFLAGRGLAGDVDKALGYYTRALEICERLLAANPESAEAARDVSLSLNNLGAFLAGRGLVGDGEKALGYYTRGLEIRERLLAANPESAEAARDASVSLIKLGDFLAGRGLAGDADKALGYYTRGLEIRERLLAANPESAQAAWDVALSLEKLGDFLEDRGLVGDGEKALGYYTRGLEIRERLLAANPESARAARDVWVSCWKLATQAEENGHFDSMKWWRKAFEILDKMKREGRFLSVQDEGFLEQLRRKVGS